MGGPDWAFVWVSGFEWEERLSPNSYYRASSVLFWAVSLGHCVIMRKSLDLSGAHCKTVVMIPSCHAVQNVRSLTLLFWRKVERSAEYYFMISSTCNKLWANESFSHLKWRSINCDITRQTLTPQKERKGPPRLQTSLPFLSMEDFMHKIQSSTYSTRKSPPAWGV